MGPPDNCYQRAGELPDLAGYQERLWNRVVIFLPALRRNNPRLSRLFEATRRGAKAKHIEQPHLTPVSS